MDWLVAPAVIAVLAIVAHAIVVAARLQREAGNATDGALGTHVWRRGANSMSGHSIVAGSDD